MQDKFTRQAANALKLAKSTAQSCNHSYIGTEHILVGLLKEKEGTAGRILEEFNVEEDALRQLIEELIAPSEVLVTEKAPEYSPRALRVLERSVQEAENQKEAQAGTEHLLVAMLKETDCVATRLLYTMGVNIQKLYVAVLTAMGIENPTAEELQGGRNQKTQKSGAATPTLDQYSRDLTVMAAEGKLDPVVGRDREITRLIQIRELVRLRLLKVWHRELFQDLFRILCVIKELLFLICQEWLPEVSIGENLRNVSVR